MEELLFFVGRIISKNLELVLNTLKTFEAFSTVSMKISLVRKGVEGWGLHVHKVETKIYENLTSKVNSKTVPISSFLDPSLMFPFHLLPSLVHLTGFYFCFFPGFLAIFILLSICHRTTTTTRNFFP